MLSMNCSNCTRDSSRQIKVLQIIDTLGMGGAETWLMEVLRLWSKNSTCHMDFLATSGNPGIFDEEAKQLGAHIYYLRYSRADLPHFVREFCQLLREGQYDAIHDHQDYSSGWHFLMGCNSLPKVRVTHVHNPSYQIVNNYGITLSRRVTAQIGKKLISRFATHITGTSRQVITEYGFDVSAVALTNPPNSITFKITRTRPLRFRWASNARGKNHGCACYLQVQGAKLFLYSRNAFPQPT
jgi:hypothetical protein